LSSWLEEQGIALSDLNEEQVLKFLKHLSLHRSIRDDDRPTLWALLEHLRAAGVIPACATPIAGDPRARVERDFGQHLIQERGLAPTSVRLHLFWARRFLSGFRGDIDSQLGTLCPQDITRFLLGYSNTLSPRAFQTMASSLRTLMRFLYQSGRTAVNLSLCVLTAPNRRLSDLPTFLKADQVEHLLQCTKKNTPSGFRDYSILLLLARLGLRAREVLNMELEDLDWASGELTVRGKSNREKRLPIPHDVGAALAKYLRHGRPTCSTRRVFVRLRSPRHALSSSAAISLLVKRALIRADLHPCRKGSHVLRHSLATRMLESGSSLEEIAEILGHQHLSTTRAYTNVNLGALRALALPWPGGES
jgi:site-specific recombinase XerD